MVYSMPMYTQSVRYLPSKVVCANALEDPAGVLKMVKESLWGWWVPGLASIWRVESRESETVSWKFTHSPGIVVYCVVLYCFWKMHAICCALWCHFLVYYFLLSLLLSAVCARNAWKSRSMTHVRGRSRNEILNVRCRSFAQPGAQEPSTSQCVDFWEGWP